MGQLSPPVAIFTPLYKMHDFSHFQASRSVLSTPAAKYAAPSFCQQFQSFCTPILKGFIGSGNLGDFGHPEVRYFQVTKPNLTLPSLWKILKIFNPHTLMVNESPILKLAQCRLVSVFSDKELFFYASKSDLGQVLGEFLVTLI